MKKVFLPLMMMFVTALVMNKVSAQVESGAKIDFTKETHDYGTIKNGSDGTCTFELKNTGNVPLIISNVKGSCSCTVPEWPKEPIAPGAKATIKVKYDTSKAGVINKNVTITSNAVNSPEKIIFIKGTVLPAPESGVPVINSGAPANN